MRDVFRRHSCVTNSHLFISIQQHLPGCLHCTELHHCIVTGGILQKKERRNGELEEEGAAHTHTHAHFVKWSAAVCADPWLFIRYQHGGTLPVRWHLVLHFAEEKRKRKIQTNYVNENGRYGVRLNEKKASYPFEVRVHIGIFQTLFLWNISFLQEMLISFVLYGLRNQINIKSSVNTCT